MTALSLSAAVADVRKFRPYTPGMEKLREWFDSPTTAAKTLVWLLWASLLLSIALGVVLIVLAALPA